ncbi:MAG TPA: VWA domain-containing protein [Xanthobacteraceae bacterium]|jgi:uncharacterized protein with von Willebrand factor type A (vWA) domain|nr:VWA domain-containing protein [Xanthobacteraceae bacterium]
MSAQQFELLGARRRLAGFARSLRDNGFQIGLAETRDALRVLASSAAMRPTSLKPALRALFCATHSDWQRFDDIFDAFWRGRDMRQRQVLSGVPGARHTPARKLAEAHVPQEALGLPDRLERRADMSGETPSDGRGRREGASDAEALSTTDLRHIVDPDEVTATHALAARLARVMRARLMRREQIRRRGRRLDLRRTIHRNVSHGGVLLDLTWRRRKIKPLRLVVLLDASGSMSLYTAFFVRFLHGVVDAFHEAEAFVFHTRLAHVSPSLRDRDVTRAVEKLSLMAQGIGGGTRIGESLATFNRWHARRVINSRSAVMIVSDGYDTGAPEDLASEMRRLRRRCKKIIWLNPLIGWRDYSPEARGMKAALPYIDLFAPAHNLQSLAALEPYLARI